MHEEALHQLFNSCCGGGEEVDFVQLVALLVVRGCCLLVPLPSPSPRLHGTSPLSVGMKACLLCVCMCVYVCVCVCVCACARW